MICYILKVLVTLEVAEDKNNVFNSVYILNFFISFLNRFTLIRKYCKIILDGVCDRYAK